MWGLGRQQIECEPAECPGSRENQPQTGLLHKSTGSRETSSSLLSALRRLQNTAPVVLSSSAPQHRVVSLHHSEPNEGGLGIGVFALCGEAAGVGLVQARE